MALLSMYSAGTVSVAADGLFLVGVGTGWDKTNARPGDPVFINGYGPAIITEYHDPQLLGITKWKYAGMSGVTYQIVPQSLNRVLGSLAMDDLYRVTTSLLSDGFHLTVPTGSAAPNPQYGYDGQIGRQYSTGKEWVRAGGAWSYRGKTAGNTFSQEPWSAAETYAAGIIVPRGVALYKSLIDNNTNFPPETSAGQWSVWTPGSNVYNGSMSLGAGSLASPSINFIGETTTGIYKSAASRVGFASQGVHAGDIGHGGINVTGNLHNFGDGGAGADVSKLLINGGSASSGGASIEFQRNSDPKWYFGLVSGISGNNSNDLTLLTQSLFAATFDASTAALTLHSTAASSSSSTGALKVNGGIGIAGAMNAAGAGTFGGALTATAGNFGSGLVTTTGDIKGKDIWAQRSATEGILYLDSSGSRYLYNSGTEFVVQGRRLRIADTTNPGASAYTTGALVVAGGIGVNGSIAMNAGILDMTSLFRTSVRFGNGGTTYSAIGEFGSGISIFSNSGLTTGVYLPTGTGAWANLSDERLPYKKTARPLGSLLDRLDDFHLYENEVEGRTELFIKAQEFYRVAPHLVIPGNDDPDHEPQGLVDINAWKVMHDRSGLVAMQMLKEHRALVSDRFNAIEARIASLENAA